MNELLVVLFVLMVLDNIYVCIYCSYKKSRTKAESIAENANENQRGDTLTKRENRQTAAKMFKKCGGGYSSRGYLI